jgi:ATP-dependent Clp protease ATP-binding subunit ClpA
MAMRFGRDARRVAQRSRDVARERGSRTVEAEHLMLALTEQRAGVACACLADAGLDREGILDALDEEAARALAAAGVDRARLIASVEEAMAARG